MAWPRARWGWVFEAGQRADAWLEQVQTLLRRWGVPWDPVIFRHELRVLFLRRRVRRPGMLETQILVETLLAPTGSGPKS